MSELGTLSVDWTGAHLLPDFDTNTVGCRTETVIFSLAGATVTPDELWLVRTGVAATPVSASHTVLPETWTQTGPGAYSLTRSWAVCWDSTLGKPFDPATLETAYYYRAVHLFSTNVMSTEAAVRLKPGTLTVTATPTSIQLPLTAGAPLSIVNFSVRGAPADTARSPATAGYALGANCQTGPGANCQWSFNQYHYGTQHDSCSVAGDYPVDVTDIYGRTASATLTVVENANADLVVVVDGVERTSHYTLNIPMSPGAEHDMSLAYRLRGSNRDQTTHPGLYMDMVGSPVDLSGYPAAGSGGWNGAACNLFDYSYFSRLYGSVQPGDYNVYAYKQSGAPEQATLTFTSVGQALLLQDATGAWTSGPQYDVQLGTAHVGDWVTWNFELFGTAINRNCPPTLIAQCTGSDTCTPTAITPYPLDSSCNGSDPECMWATTNVDNTDLVNRYTYQRTLTCADGPGVYKVAVWDSSVSGACVAASHTAELTIRFHNQIPGCSSSCTGTARTCVDSTTAAECVAGQQVLTDCSQWFQSCSAGACSGATACTPGEWRCVGGRNERCNASGAWYLLTDCTARGESCFDGDCIGSAQAGQACAVIRSSISLNTSAPSCGSGLICSYLAPGGVGGTCSNAAVDCPIHADWHPICSGNQCTGTACVAPCGAGDTCGAGMHPSGTGSSCHCVPGTLGTVGGLCNAAYPCAAGLDCMTWASGSPDWNYCTATCSSSATCGALTCSIPTTPKYCGKTCAGPAATTCGAGWHCLNVASSGTFYACMPL